jgi:AraC-like DNA-binding protein
METINSKVLRPLFDYIRADCRFVSEALEANNLPTSIMVEGELEVPRFAICRAACHMAFEEADPTLLFRSAIDSPVIGTPTSASVPTTENTVQLLCAFVDSLNGLASGIETWWEIDQQYFWFMRSPAARIKREAFEVELYAVGLFLRFLKAKLPRDWRPDILRTRSSEPCYGGRLSKIAENCYFGGHRASAVAIPLERLLPSNETNPMRWLRERSEGAHRIASPDLPGKRLRDVVSIFVASGDPGVANIAAAFGVSSRTLRRRIRESLGFDYRTLVMDCKMTLAVEKLRSSSLKVSEISEQLGYAYQGDFTRAFRKHIGITPTEVRMLASSRESQ